MTKQASADTPRRTNAGLRLLARLGVTLVIAYVLWCAALWWKQTDLVFPRSFANAAPRLSEAPRGATSWWREDEGARVEAWWFAGIGTSPETPGPAVMLFHGNGETIDNWEGIANEYVMRGVSVLLPEYRGYGRSTGEPSQAAIARDMLHWHTKLLEQSSVASDRIVLHGRSLGGGVAMQLAKEREPAAMILESTFTSVAAFAQQYYVPSFIVRHPFRSDKVIGGLSCPILIAHGRDDEIIPFSHGEELARLARNATFVEVSGGHNDFPGDQDRYDREWWGFLRARGIIKAVE
jgi:fermentation-respiration switch protein FrsA (DUF1100 family)